MAQGAAGVSLGLQYEPGIFAPPAELEFVARLVRRYDKILTVHPRAFSTLSGAYPYRPLGRPHNLQAIEDMIALARKHRLLDMDDLRLIYEHSDNKLIVFTRARLLFAFNFHPEQSYRDYRF